VEKVERGGITIDSAQWSAETVAKLIDHLAGHGTRALAAVDDAELLEAWGATVEAFFDGRSDERRRLAGPLLALTGLSAQGLAAGLEAVLGGMRARPHAKDLLARARRLRKGADGAHGAPYGTSGDQPLGDRPDAAYGTHDERSVNEPLRRGVRRAHHSTPASEAASRAPAFVVLAGNVPALAVQPLLPALVMRRPALLKSASAEPLFAPAFVAALARRLPAIGDGVAALTWVGGDPTLEAPVLARADPVLVYGGRAAVTDLQRRAAGRVVDYGPKLSFAVVGADADLARAAAGVARDVALFDQRGCLSVQAAFVEGGAARATAFGEALATALAAFAIELPPGAVDAMQASAVQQIRGAAEMRGALASRLPIGAGTVVVEPAGAPLVPSPGLRTVRVYPVTSLKALPEMLARWCGLLQGAALAGESALALAPALAHLGVSRCTAPGELQAADASWHNGGHDPLDVLSPPPLTP